MTLGKKVPGEERPHLVFLHIWKCGGTSLHAFLGETLRGYKLVDASLRLEADDWLRRYPHIGGHFLWEQVASLPRDRTKLAIVFREPVARTISQFNFCRANETVFHLHGSLSLHHALSKIVDRGQREQFCMLSNLQTSVLAGLARQSADPLERLAVAKENLKSFDLVGLTEHLPLFGATIRASFTVDENQPSAPVPHLNQTKDQPDLTLPNETLALIAEANKLDAELYREAANRIHDNSAHELNRPLVEYPGRGGICEFGNGACRLADIQAEPVSAGFVVRATVRSQEPGEYNLGFMILDELGAIVCGINTVAMKARLVLPAGATQKVEMTAHLALPPGEHTVILEVRDEFSVCHRTAAKIKTLNPSSPIPGIGLTRPLFSCKVTPGI